MTRLSLCPLVLALSVAGWCVGCGSGGASDDQPELGGGAGGTAGNDGSPGGTRISLGGARSPSANGFLHVEGNQLKDDAGNVAGLTGVNWFGFETQNLMPHGLWTRDYRSMMHQIADVGFNVVRIPWSNRLLAPDAVVTSLNTYGTDPYDGNDPINAALEGLTPLEMLDKIIEAAGEYGLKVILDNHSRKPDGYMEEQLWYSDVVSEEQWILDWMTLADRYYGNPTVVAVDLDNEPHGSATWGTGNASTDWNSAAERCGNAILNVNPDVLILVEGVEKVGSDSYWWGGNLSEVRSTPITLSNPQKLVYSAHEYGPEVFAQPWFTAGNFPSNLSGIWDSHFGFIMNEQLGHVLIGEFGLKDRSAASGAVGEWFDAFMTYMGSSYSWTFWCWNPNSGDTQGILQDDWVTPHQWKLDALAPYLAPPIGR